MSFILLFSDEESFAGNFCVSAAGDREYYFVAGKKTVPESGRSEGVIGSIKEAMAGMEPIECAYADEQGNQVTAMVRGENIKVSGYAAGETGAKGNTLIKGNTMYIWEEGAKEGMMLSFDREAAEKAETGDKKEETIENLEKYKDSCKRGSFSDSVFEAPAEVKFTDFSQSLINPDTTNDSSGQAPSSTDVEKMMEQYKNMPGAGNE